MRFKLSTKRENLGLISTHELRAHLVWKFKHGLEIFLSFKKKNINKGDNNEFKEIFLSSNVYKLIFLKMRIKWIWDVLEPFVLLKIQYLAMVYWYINCQNIDYIWHTEVKQWSDEHFGMINKVVQR